MRFWFSQVPVYPQQVRDVTGLIFNAMGVAIAAAVACSALSPEPRLLVTFGTLLLLGVLLLLAGRSWARRRGLPFVPFKDAAALNRAKEGARPLPGVLLWSFLPSGVLTGLIAAQVLDGHPFWQADKLSWTTATMFGMATVIGGVWRRAGTLSRSRTQGTPT